MPSPTRFSELIRARGANVKSLLLDQSFSAGVGNWIADEVLYQAGIDPRRHATSLTDEEARRVRARGLRPSSSAPSPPTPTMRATPRAWLFHRRWGKRAEARTTRGERIEHLTIGGRTTAWVPAAQH